MQMNMKCECHFAEEGKSSSTGIPSSVEIRFFARSFGSWMPESHCLTVVSLRQVIFASSAMNNCAGESSFFFVS